MTRIDNARVIRAPRGTELSRQELADRSAAAHADEQPRPRGGRAARTSSSSMAASAAPRATGRASTASSRRCAARGRRDAAGAVRQAGRRLPHPCRRAARADRQLQPRAALGDLGAFPRARSQGPDDVRPDDRRLVDLHRHARASCRAPTRPSSRSAAGTTAATSSGRWILTAGLGGMGGAQPLAATMAGASMLAVECQPTPHRDAAADRLPRRAGDGPRRGAGHDRALVPGAEAASRSACSATPPRSSRSWCGAACGPTCVTDQTSAHDPINGYLPKGWTLAEWEAQRESDPKAVEQRRQGVDGRACARHARLPRRGRADARLRQQHPPDGEGGGRRRRLRLSRASCRPISARCSAAASGRSAGRRCRAIRRTSTAPTPR